MMLRKILGALGVVLVALVLYLTLWPVPVEPVGWAPQPSPGYTGPYAANPSESTRSSRTAGGASPRVQAPGAGTRCNAIAARQAESARPSEFARFHTECTAWPSLLTRSEADHSTAHPAATLPQSVTVMCQQ